MRAYHERMKDYDSALSLAPGNVYWWRKSKTAGGDVYCTGNVDTTENRGRAVTESRGGEDRERA